MNNKGMEVDEETRRALHELRDIIHSMQLASAVSSGEVKSSMVKMSGQIETLIEQNKQVVTQPEFTPVKMICYGMTSLVLSGFIGAILTMVYVYK